MKQFDRKFGRTLCDELPTSPGVYLFQDEAGQVLYVGKAKNLRRRLRDYRNASRRKVHRKMRALVREATTLEIRPQPCERDALLLENELIRTLRPPFNVDGAFYFLYPAVGIWRNGPQTLFCLTTSPDAWSGFPFGWHGSFRSRRTKDAFDAMLSLLTHLGHIESKASLPKLPYVRGSRVVGFRRLDPALVASLDRFWAGDRSDTLALLAEHLLDRTAARRSASEVEDHLKLLRRFHKSDILKLRAAIRTTGRPEGFVPQQQRDSLFIASRTTPDETT